MLLKFRRSNPYCKGELRLYVRQAFRACFLTNDVNQTEYKPWPGKMRRLSSMTSHSEKARKIIGYFYYYFFLCYTEGLEGKPDLTE